MRILLYIDSMYYGGAQRVMSVIANYLSMYNQEVVLITDVTSDKSPEYKIDDRVIRYVLCKNEKLSNFKRIIKIRKIVKECRPNVVLSFLGPPNYRMILATLGIFTKKIVSVRNDPYREYGYGLKKLLANILFLFADGYVFQTNDVANYFFKSIRKKSRVIFNPVDRKFLDTDWIGSNNEIAVVGRLQLQKNPLLVLNAFRIIAKDFPDEKLVYYGDDELKDEIVRLSKEYNIENRVVIYGKTNEVEKKLALSNLFVLSSDYEGMPNALLEAMSVGVPVISTDCPCGGPRTIIDNNQGILVPCNNVVALADAMKRVLNDNDLRTKLSSEEKKRAISFDVDTVMKDWIDYINMCIND